MVNLLLLVERTPPTRAPTNLCGDQCGTVFRATTPRVTLVHEIAHVRTSPGAQLAQRGPQVAMERFEFSVRKCISSFGRQPGPPQGLVSEKIPDAGQPMLIEEASLQWGDLASRWRRSEAESCRSWATVTVRASGPSDDSSGESSTEPNRRGS